VRPVPLDEIGQNYVAEGVEVLAVSKEVGFTDRDFGCQRVQLNRSAKGVAQNVQIGIAAGNAQA